MFACSLDKAKYVEEPPENGNMDEIERKYDGIEEILGKVYSNEVES